MMDNGCMKLQSVYTDGLFSVISDFIAFGVYFSVNPGKCTEENDWLDWNRGRFVLLSQCNIPRWDWLKMIERMRILFKIFVLACMHYQQWIPISHLRHRVLHGQRSYWNTRRASVSKKQYKAEQQLAASKAANTCRGVHSAHSAVNRTACHPGICAFHFKPKHSGNWGILLWDDDYLKHNNASNVLNAHIPGVYSHTRAGEFQKPCQSQTSM